MAVSAGFVPDLRFTADDLLEREVAGVLGCNHMVVRPPSVLASCHDPAFGIGKVCQLNWEMGGIFPYLSHYLLGRIKINK